MQLSCSHILRSAVPALCAIVGLGGVARAQRSPAPSAPPVLVELFTSEGCSSCPPADALLREIDGGHTPTGGRIIVLSEHVTYWNSLGWRDPFSADSFTARQGLYGDRFQLDSVYTPQIVVNGREQIVGSDRGALATALGAESMQPHIRLHIDSAQVAGDRVTFRYSATALPTTGPLHLVAVLVDDTDHSSVLRGENSGRELTHTSVARALAVVGPVTSGDDAAGSIPLPPSFLTAGRRGGHHLVLFAQERDNGPILGVDSVPL